MGLPFRSGHILGRGRSPASSIGPGYTSVWHRDPQGRWIFYQDQPAELACTRYFGSAVEEVRGGGIRIDWSGSRGLQVRAGGGDLQWEIELGSTPVTRLLNGVGAAVPARAWRSRSMLAVMSLVAGPALRACRVRLTGLAPNGQRFAANPLIMWVATDSSATVRGVDLGRDGCCPRAGAPRRLRHTAAGLFVVGRAMFTGAASRRTDSAGRQWNTM